MPFVLTAKAVDDLKEIGRYTQKTWGVAQRNKYLQMLDDGFHELADDPQRGLDCRDVREGYRKLKVGRHVIFYRLKQNQLVEIVRVLHEKMDFDTHLNLN